MKSPVCGLKIASVVFGLMSLAHLIRVIACIGLQVGNWYVGRRWSIAAVVVLAALSAWMWLLACKASKSKGDIPPASPAA
jgi:hypothetical protein